MGRPRKDAGSPKKKKRAKNPDHPKRAVTAYFYYLSAFREQRKKEGKSIRPGDIAKEAANDWNHGLSPEKKEPYMKKAREDRERYDSEMVVYDKKYKKYKDPNKPKKPATAFFLFLADFRLKMKGEGLPHKEINSKAGVEWGEMTEEDKEKYKTENGKLRQKYEKDMAKYNEEAAAKNGSSQEAATNEEEEMEDEEDDDDDDEVDDE